MSAVAGIDCTAAVVLVPSVSSVLPRSSNALEYSDIGLSELSAEAAWDVVSLTSMDRLESLGVWVWMKTPRATVRNSRAATAGSSVCTCHAGLRRANKRACAPYRSLLVAVSVVSPAIALHGRAWGG